MHNIKSMHSILTKKKKAMLHLQTSSTIHARYNSSMHPNMIICLIKSVRILFSTIHESTIS